jgi:TonB family protein
MIIHKVTFALSVFALFASLDHSMATENKKLYYEDTFYLSGTSPQKKKTPPAGDKIVEDPDIPAMFTGGNDQMKKFIASALVYPKEASEKNIEGLVVYTFVVEKDGTLTNFECIHHADPALDAEALRILQMMPPWRPAKLNGENVRSTGYVPMYFRLNKNAKQSKSIAAKPVAKSNPTLAVDEEVLAIVDKMPQFPGGEKKLSTYLSNQIKYPDPEYQRGIEGRVVCAFIVDRDGNIHNIEVIEGENEALNREAVRVLSTMPKWEPGENGGQKVNVKCLLPIEFKIDKTLLPEQNVSPNP